MKPEIIKSKRVTNGALELIKFTNDYDRDNVVKYEISLGCMSKDVLGGGAGKFKKIAEFDNFYSNEEEIIKFEKEIINFFEKLV